MLLIGILAIAFLPLVFLTLITLYWVFTQGERFARQVPALGGYIGNVFAYLRDRNQEIVRQVVAVAIDIVSWSVDRVEDGLRIYNDIFNASSILQIGQIVFNLTGLSKLVDNNLQPTVNALKTSQNALAFLVHGFVQLNIDALNFWKDATTATLANYVLPNIASLIIVTDSMAKVLLPGMQKQLDDVTQAALGWINGVGKDMRVELSNLQVTTSAVLSDPVKGVVPRVGAIEGIIGQVLPWATTIGLSIPIARTLARVGRNPCTCLEEDGQTDMLPLLLYLFEEAG